MLGLLLAHLPPAGLPVPAGPRPRPRPRPRSMQY